MLETNLDDVSGMVLGDTQECLCTMGPLDVWYTPIQMKKNRKGTTLFTLVPEDLEQAAVEIILRETTTFGIRSRPVERHVAERQSVTIETEIGAISVKVKSLGGGAMSVAPESDNCRRIALETGIPFQGIYQRVV